MGGASKSSNKEIFLPESWEDSLLFELPNGANAPSGRDRRHRLKQRRFDTPPRAGNVGKPSELKRRPRRSTPVPDRSRAVPVSESVRGNLRRVLHHGG
jgi:hypothetical protein